MGPLKQSTINSRYFVTPAGNAVFLAGSHTWNDFMDTDTSGSTPAAFDFNAYVSFLKQNGHNATILWRKDLPEYCGWDFSGSTWKMGPWPWMRPGPGVATDGNLKFDLSQLDLAYFTRLRARVQQLQQNGIYAIVQLFDINQLTYVRCSTDGYPFTGANNVNGVSDGYVSGTNNFTSYSMITNNAISNFQDAYAKKVVDTLNDLPNVLYEVSEEQVSEAMTWWAPHMMGLVQAYEGGGTFEGTVYTAKPFQHPVGIGAMNFGDKNDPGLYASIANWIAPEISGTAFPSNVQTNNLGKVVINDSDHALNYVAFLNANGSVQDQNLRGYIWENITQGAEGLVFMDPYEIVWAGNLRNTACLTPVNNVCTGGPDPKYNPFRQAMGLAQAYVNAKMDLLKATPQASLSSTGFCLADNAATGAEYLIYTPSGGTFTVNLSAPASRALNVEWLNPTTGATTPGTPITGGSSSQSFTAPFSGDAVLYIVDAAGHN
ncbi:MAG TPA: putative collagen-binding domain-containing protein [Candidatus Acidoferrum sp.]|nr:putative collagen-binding domain-containing protein [Candidatus Acidoferrum sp.]